MKTNQTQKKILTGWQQVKLGDVSDIYTGGTPDTNSQEFWGGAINWITPTEITKTGKYIKNETEKKITELGLRNSSAKLLPKDSLVICTRATVGECSISTYPISTNQGFKNLIPKKNTTVDFLYYFIKSIKPKLMKLGSGSTFLEVSKGDIEKLKFILPPLSEQNRIVSVLETWDKAIEKLSKKIEVKKQIKKGLMQNLLTGKIRLSNFKDKWQEVKFGDLFTERSERGIKNLPLLSITSDRGVIYQSQSNKKDTSNADKSKYLRICSGDIGYNTMRMWQGRSALSGVEGMVSPAYTILKPKNEVDSRYFAYLFKTPRVVDYFFQKSQGLVSDTWQCRYKDFAIIRYNIPTYKEQKLIADVLETTDKEILELEKKLSIIKEQKRYLLNNLITGTIRTPENLK